MVWFIEEFEAFANGHKDTHLGQRTLYPDVIESAGHGAGAKVVKSHHNVGGLPEKLALKLVEPFDSCLKMKFVKLVEPSIPEHLLAATLPRPGLAVRILSEITAEKVAILQEADNIFIEALRKNDLYDKVCKLCSSACKICCVMGDNRSYQWTAASNVTASDGMTTGVGDLQWSS